jgi:tRNA(Ile)-lysidine synthase
MIAAPEPQDIARFRADVARLGGAEGKLGLAVSGGPDSLALLILAHAAFPGGVAAATVDHRLRPEARAEADHVARICAILGCPHAILPVQVEDRGQGLQGDARDARYKALEDWARGRGIMVLATAHHADDQAETIVMRLWRGSGLAGLSGIRPSRRLASGLSLIRPLLGWRRSDLARLVIEAGLTAVDDPSNRDPRFDRVRIRAFLKGYPEFDPLRAVRSASALQEAQDALLWATENLAGSRSVTEDGLVRIDVGGLPRALRRLLLARALAAVHKLAGLPWRDSEDVEGLLCVLEEGGTATLGGAMASGGAVWHVRPAPPRRPGRPPLTP